MIKISSFHFSEHTLYGQPPHTLTRTRTCPNNHAAADLIFIVGHCFRLPLIVCSGDCDGIINFADPYCDCRPLLLLWYIFDEKENSIIQMISHLGYCSKSISSVLLAGNQIEIHIVLYQKRFFFVIAANCRSIVSIISCVILLRKLKVNHHGSILFRNRLKSWLQWWFTAANIDDI